MRIRRLVILLVVALAASSPLEAADISFERDVAPILARRCLTCHNAREHKGDFRLDTESQLEESGFVEPGDVESSFLLEVIQPADGRPPRMPKDSDPLTKDQVTAIRRWVASGAKWPTDYKLEPPKVTDRNWWSLKPVQRVSPPQPSDPISREWIRTPVDAFVYDVLKREGLGPSAAADRRTLIRRVTYDLTGLPPAAKEVEAFLADTSPAAYERLVERLLGSPHYGERWARHWLDVVHYADTHGYDKDKLRPNAWPYRDYVIRAFNSDKPYGRFVREQLAGDALFPASLDGQVATGFIAAGPWDFIGHAEVPETKLDGKVARNLDRDNMVTSTMTTFCSLTVQCARCHHHKLDPVTMEDYYRLQAVFASIDRADHDFDGSSEVAAQRAELVARETRLTALIQQQQKEAEKRKSPAILAIEKQLAALQGAMAQEKTKVPRSAAFGYHSNVAPSQDIPKWVQVDLGSTMPIEHVYLFGADEYGFADFGFPHRFRVEVSSDPDFRESQVIGDFQKKDVPRPGAQGFHILGNDVRGRFIRLTATKLWSRRRKGQPKSGDWIFAIGEMAVVSDGELKPVVAVDSADSIEAGPRWARAALIDGIYGGHSLDTLRGSDKRSSTNGFHSQFAKSAETTKTLTVDLGAPKQLDQVNLVPAFPTDWADTPGFGFPVRFRLELASDAEFKHSRTILDSTESDFANPGQETISLSLLGRPANERTGQFLRVTATKLWDRGNKQHALALAEIEALSQGINVALDASVTASDSIESGRWAAANLVDGQTSRMPTRDVASDLAALSQSQSSKLAVETLIKERDAAMRELVGEAAWRSNREREAELADVKKSIGSLPKPGRVYAGIVHQGSGAFRGRGGLGPRTIHVLHRGNIDQPGARVAAGAPPLTPNGPTLFGLTEDEPEWKRRIALADWITHQSNPLTWRSIVNRIWVHHFGRGLADTPNDFGRGGKKPTHPELLDWLAAEFRDNGRSIKSLHRLIVTSSVYRQASDGDAQKEKLDADNRFYWRMNRRRLSAEEVRDTMLLVAGRLDRSQGGPGFMDFIIEQPQHSPHYEYEKHNPNDMKTQRRTIYRFIVRSQPQPFMDTLDCADPSISVPKRDETLTSLQALAMLNNRFVLAMAENFSKRMESAHHEQETQVRRAIRLALGREPKLEEVELLSAYAAEHGLANACRLMFNLNEFVFVD